jgi:signal recognition particle GTPase
MISGVEIGQMDLQGSLDRMLAIYRSMTFAEQETPAAIDASARERIASRAGISVAEVDQFISDYEKARMMMHTVERMASDDR